MPLGISTHLFFADRLHPSHLDTLAEAGAQTIEVFASRHHFNYTDRQAIRELGNWFSSHPVTPTLHMPLFTEDEEAEWSRRTQPTLNLIAREKRLRIAAMDECKRAIESAEGIPFRSCVLHLGLRDERWSTEALDLSLTAIEHLKAFATPLGVQLLLENLSNDVATPAHLVEITQVGHFDTVGFCLDTGHAHVAQPLLPEEPGYSRHAREQLRERWGDAALRDALPEALAIFNTRLVELHLHDNNGLRDEHLWPGTAEKGKGLDWAIPRTALEDNPNLNAVLEIAYDPATPARDLQRNVHQTQTLLNQQPR